MVTEPNEGYLLCSLEVVTLFGRTMFMLADMTKQPYNTDCTSKVS